MGKHLHEIISRDIVLNTINIDKIKKESVYLRVINYNPETYKENDPRKIFIPKDNGKHRDIYLYDILDNTIQKLVLNYIIDEYGNNVSERVFSYKKGVSTYNAIKEIRNNCINKTGYKIDISNYFNSVNSKYIIDYINKYINNDIDYALREFLINHFNKSKAFFKNFQIGFKPSLQAGSPLSSYFSNAILIDIDNYIENHTHIYSRYGDDIIFLCDTREESEKTLNNIKYKLKEMELEVNEDKTELIDPNKKGFDYLGVYIDNGKIDLSKKHWNRRKSKVKSVCSKYKKLISKHGDRDFYIKELIRDINKIFYTSVKENDKIYSDAEYIFKTINILDNLYNLEYYINDRIRQSYTGKNNSANINKLDNKKLNELGLLKLTDMYKIYKTDKLLYKYIIWYVNNNKTVNEKDKRNIKLEWK